jgi:hypothetical protein
MKWILLLAYTVQGNPYPQTSWTMVNSYRECQDKLQVALGVTVAMHENMIGASCITIDRRMDFSNGQWQLPGSPS